jgi:hypothetical protein
MFLVKKIKSAKCSSRNYFYLPHPFPSTAGYKDRRGFRVALIARQILPRSHKDTKYSKKINYSNVRVNFIISKLSHSSQCFFARIISIPKLSLVEGFNFFCKCFKTSTVCLYNSNCYGTAFISLTTPDFPLWVPLVTLHFNFIKLFPVR